MYLGKFFINLIPIRKLRRKLRNKYYPSSVSYDKYNFTDCEIHSNIEHPEYLSMGKHVWIGGDCKIFPSKIANIKFGNNIYIAMNTTIYTTFHNYQNENMLPFDYSDICSPVEIGDNVWIGSHCIILPGVKIDEGAVIASGSVVSKSVPKCAVVAGNPARIVKYRDIELYERLKSKGNYPSFGVTPNSAEKVWILKDEFKPYLK